MKSSLAIAGFICISAFWIYFFISFGDEAKFTRTIQDLQWAPDKFKNGDGISDAWGNRYKVVSATSGAQTVEYVISLGPDGRSDSLGHDPDDITQWTNYYRWISTLHPIFIMRLYFMSGILLFVTSISFYYGRSRGNNQRAQQVAPRNR